MKFNAIYMKTTLAPSFDNTFAVSFPIPVLEPVMRATFPSILGNFFSLLGPNGVNLKELVNISAKNSKANRNSTYILYENLIFTNNYNTMSSLRVHLI